MPENGGWDRGFLLRISYGFPDLFFALTVLGRIFWDIRFVHVILDSLVKKDAIYLRIVKFVA